MKKAIFYYLVILANVVIIPVNAQDNSAVTFKEKYRPQYHLTTTKGALIDPTALVYVNGLYQVNRRVAVSKDLVHWKQGNRERLNTDTTREMSGSVVIDSNNTSGFGSNGKAPLVAVYSALRNSDGRQFQCIAWSVDEGISWNAYNKNPVIDIGSNEFRDPQVFWYAPSKKWVMAVAMAAEQKVRFYNSDNLKDWVYLSEFGQTGAVRGVWECPDLFPLPVDGNQQKIKWVLVVSVQPVGGQYFIGEFDGKNFIPDNDFLLRLRKLKDRTPQPAGKVLFDFESGLSGWTKEGDAFTKGPVHGTLPNQSPVIGYVGDKLINSYLDKDSSIGKIVSPSFIIDKKYINFLIGGGDHPGKTGINLVIDNKIVRTKTGVNTEILYPANWELAEFRGQTAHVEIVDDYAGSYGHTLIDEIALSDTPAVNKREETAWIDYGPDFYAERSWINGPDNRKIWVAWMGSWLYAFSVPTNPWKGGHSFPREIQLKTFPEGIKLLQNPVNEIKEIRGKHSHIENILLRENIPFKGVNVDENTYEISAEFEVKQDAKFGMDFCIGQNKKIRLSYTKKTEMLELDRSQSGETSFSSSFPHSYQAPLKIRNNRIKLRILVDHSSIEVFGNDGEVALTCQVFPDPQSKGIEVFSEKGEVKLLNLDIWLLKSIWGK